MSSSDASTNKTPTVSKSRLQRGGTESTEATTTGPHRNVFRIHPDNADRAIHLLPFPTRAQNVLKSIGAKTLGNLDGMAFETLLQSKNCGFKTYERIVQLVEPFQQKGEVADVFLKGWLSSSQEVVVNVPDEAKDWLINQLPFSVRLRHMMQKLKCKVLGDLQGRAYKELSQLPNCGARTVFELRQFIGKIQRGEFGVESEYPGQTPAAFLVSKIDAYVASLAGRDRTILMDRVGAKGVPLTLLKVGQKFKMTRERIRQIIAIHVDGIVRFGGPPFSKHVETLTQELTQEVLPLTPELLRHLIGPQAKPAYNLGFYIRLLGWISPKLAVWPTGQTPTAYRSPAQEKIISALISWFEGRKGSASTKEAYQGIVAGGTKCSSFDFLQALSYAAEFGIQFDDPSGPRISPPEASPRNWARAVLASESLSAVPRETLLRAKALLKSRHSPTSRYRLAVPRGI